MTDETLRRQAERRVNAKLGFRTHALVYVLVNAGLLAINLLTSPGTLWFYWPLIGWSVGLAAHGLAVHLGGAERREKAIAAEMAALGRARGGAPPPAPPSEPPASP